MLLTVAGCTQLRAKEHGGRGVLFWGSIPCVFFQQPKPTISDQEAGGAAQTGAAPPAQQPRARMAPCAGARVKQGGAAGASVRGRELNRPI
jgi:hypothetical protein